MSVNKRLFQMDKQCNNSLFSNLSIFLYGYLSKYAFDDTPQTHQDIV